MTKEAAKEQIGWAIVELMGHRKLAGYVTEVEVAGAGMLRLDIPETSEGKAATQFYGPSSVYCITPTTEDIARRLALQIMARPVERWELPEAKAPASDVHDLSEGGPW